MIDFKSEEWFESAPVELLILHRIQISEELAEISQGTAMIYAEKMTDPGFIFQSHISKPTNEEMRRGRLSVYGEMRKDLLREIELTENQIKRRVLERLPSYKTLNSM